LATLRVNLVLVILFSLLDLTYLFLMVSELTGSLTVQKVAGGVGLATAAVAYYAGAAQLLTEDNSWFTLPVGLLHRRRLN
jgi:succinate-acetate transporter protein